MRNCVRVFWLVLVIGAGGGALAQQGTGVQKKAPAAKHLTTAEAQALTAEVLAKVERIRALALKHKLEVSVKNKPELRDYLIEKTKKEMPEELFVATQKALQKLGLIPKTMNLEGFVIDLLTEQIAGFYDEDAKKLFLMADTPMMLQKTCLSHEITHAIQDEHFDLKGLDLDRKDNDDYVLAVKSLAEGDAVIVMMDYIVQGAAADLQMLTEAQRLAENPAIMSTEVLESAPNYIKSQLLFPYMSGVSFVTSIKQRGGWAFVNEAYRHPPLSSEQILHPEKYLDKPDLPILVTMPDLSAAMGQAWKRLMTNVMGEISVRVLMKEFKQGEKAPSVAAGWGGDEIGVYQWLPPANAGGGEKIAIAWFTAWDSETDASEFFDAYTALIRQKYPESHVKGGAQAPAGWSEKDQAKAAQGQLGHGVARRRVWFTAQDDALLEQRKTLVLVIEGCPDDRVEAVAAEAWKAKMTLAAFTPPALPKGAKPQADANPMDGLLKGMGAAPEGVGDLLNAFLQGAPSKGEVIGNTYRDHTHEFEITAPGPGWRIERETPLNMMPVMLISPATSASVNVAVFNMSLAPVEAWAPMLEMMLPMQFQQFKKLSGGPITVNQMPAYEMTYSGSKDGVQVRIQQIILATGAKTYVITFGAMAELYKDSDKDFEKILRSFRLTKPPEKVKNP